MKIMCRQGKVLLILARVLGSRSSIIMITTKRNESYIHILLNNAVAGELPSFSAWCLRMYLKHVTRRDHEP